MRKLLLGLVVQAWLLWPWAALHAESAREEHAELILVGQASSEPALRLVLRELLERDGVHPTFTLAPHFVAETLLAEPDADGRVRVFITLADAQLARLYLRGPFGRRFLLRELLLRNGLDELGRESIAQVVATSTQALLHSSAGVDRETAKADVMRTQTRSAAPTVPPVEPAFVPSARPAPATAPARVRLRYELGLRGSAAWNGAALRARRGGGAEAALTEELPARLLVRERLVFEQFALQQLRPSELIAQVRTSALRLGVDLGRPYARGEHALLGGVAVGLDLLHVSPQRARDPSWALAKRRIDVVPMLRAELRYERRFSVLCLSAAAYADVVLVDSQFEVREGERTRRVAHPWRVSPGLALSLGWRSP